MLFSKSIAKKTKRKTNFAWQQVIVATLAFFVLAQPLTVQARLFDPDNIINNDDLFNKDALSKTAIQKFLDRENSVLARFSQIVEGQTLTAAEMIWQVGQKHNVSPKFILATLEKEQSLISKSYATEKALDWATGYGCYAGTCKEKHRGFYNQIEATAETQEIYRQRANEFGFRVGVTTQSFDNYAVTPENQATANLYIYTPYVGNAPELGIVSRFGGNRLFWRIWNRYFPSQKFQDGQIVTDGSSYWLIKNNTKQKFTNAEIFLTDYNASAAIYAKAKDLAAYPDGPMIYFANKTLVKSAASGQIFFIDQLTKRPVIDASALALLQDFKIALSESEITAVTDDRLAAYSVGELIFTSSIYPQGKLFKDESGNIWQVQNGIKHPVDQIVWLNRFANQTPELTNSSALASYPNGEPIKLKDGTFVNNDGKYYLVSNGERMRIQDDGVFERTFGLEKRANATVISTALLEVHSAGEMIDYIDDTITDTYVPITPINPAISNYAGQITALQPEGIMLVTGAKQSITVVATNAGGTTWLPGNVWLQLSDPATFAAPEKINFQESSVANGQNATFTFDLTAPTDQTGLLNQEFRLYANISGTPTQTAAVGKIIFVKAGITAQVVSQNLPVAVRNDWKPIPITLQIKNLSNDISWLSRRTALEVYNEKDQPSPFYDPNDWVRETVAAVPINKSTIKPGETGEFKFTIDPRGLKKGEYVLRFKLKLLDKNKEVYLDGKLNWDRVIRVD